MRQLAALGAVTAVLAAPGKDSSVLAAGVCMHTLEREADNGLKRLEALAEDARVRLHWRRLATDALIHENWGSPNRPTRHSPPSS